VDDGAEPEATTEALAEPVAEVLAEAEPEAEALAEFLAAFSRYSEDLDSSLKLTSSILLFISVLSNSPSST